MTVYALTNLQTGEVEVRWEKDFKPADRDGWVWLVDNGQPDIDHLNYGSRVGPVPIPADAPALPYEIFELDEAEKKIRFNRPIEWEIKDMEQRQMTPRRIRDALLGVDGGWMANFEAQIQAKRDTMRK